MGSDGFLWAFRYTYCPLFLEFSQTLYTHEDRSTSAGSLFTIQPGGEPCAHWWSHPGRCSPDTGKLYPLHEVKREADNPYSLEMPGSSLKDNSMVHRRENSLPQRQLLLGPVKWRLCCHLIFRFTNSGCWWLFLASSWLEFRANCAKTRAVWGFLI